MHRSRSPCHGEGHTKDGISAKIALGLGSIKLKHLLINTGLVGYFHAKYLFGNYIVNVMYSFQHPFPEVSRLVAVS